MTMRRIRSLIDRLAHDTQGTTLVEYGIVLVVFLIVVFAILDFGRLGFEYVWAQKAMQKAARIAIVRPPACPGVPDYYAPGTNLQPYGTNCRSAAGVCAIPATVSCDGDPTNPTAAEIWGAISNLMPPGATVANLRFSYSPNSDFGFLGGPYEPMVTVNLQNLNFQFISPLAGLTALAGMADPALGSGIAFPAMSVSLPGEDLAQGENG